jgi:hypothetical protein
VTVAAMPHLPAARLQAIADNTDAPPAVIAVDATAAAAAGAAVTVAAMPHLPAARLQAMADNTDAPPAGAAAAARTAAAVATPVPPDGVLELLALNLQTNPFFKQFKTVLEQHGSMGRGRPPILSAAAVEGFMAGPRTHGPVADAQQQGGDLGIVVEGRAAEHDHKRAYLRYLACVHGMHTPVLARCDCYRAGGGLAISNAAAVWLPEFNNARHLNVLSITIAMCTW